MRLLRATRKRACAQADAALAERALRIAQMVSTLHDRRQGDSWKVARNDGGRADTDRHFPEVEEGVAEEPEGRGGPKQNAQLAVVPPLLGRRRRETGRSSRCRGGNAG